MTKKKTENKESKKTQLSNMVQTQKYLVEQMQSDFDEQKERLDREKGYLEALESVMDTLFETE